MKSNENYIPDEAYRFFPPDNELKNKDGMRWFFDGPLVFEQKEKDTITKFRAYAEKHKYTLTPMWNDNLVLRFLQACSFKLDRTLACVKEHTTWRDTKLPQQKTSEVEEFLKSGVMYVHGRDHRYRPIVVFNAYLVNPKKMDVDVMIEALTYLFEIIIGKMLLPGQIEHWIFIMDLKGMGVTSLPINAMKKLLGFLQQNYRGRLKSLYIINTPGTIFVPWQIAKGFLEEHTVKKIQFIKKDTPEPLFQHANRDQVEEKFGGTARNLTVFWPPQFPSSNYLLPGDDSNSLLISKEKYQTLFQQGKLQKYTINEQVISHEQDIITQKPKIQDSSSQNQTKFPNTSEENKLNDKMNNFSHNPGSKSYEYDYYENMDEYFSFSLTKPEIRSFNPRFIEFSKKFKAHKGEKGAKPLL
jgi:hypothetical protein